MTFAQRVPGATKATPEMSKDVTDRLLDPIDRRPDLSRRAASLVLIVPVPWPSEPWPPSCETMRVELGGGGGPPAPRIPAPGSARVDGLVDGSVEIIRRPPQLLLFEFEMTREQARCRG